jgi:hypothetical protein
MVDDNKIRVNITASQGESWSTEIKDQDGRHLICCWPINIEITPKGIFAHLKVPVDSLNIDGAQSIIEPVVNEK